MAVSQYANQYAQHTPVTPWQLQHNVDKDDLTAPWVILGPHGHYCTLCGAHFVADHANGGKHTRTIPWAFQRDWYNANTTFFRPQNGTAIVNGYNWGMGPPPATEAVAKAIPPVPKQAVAALNQAVPKQAVAALPPPVGNPPPAQVLMSDLTQAFSDAMQQVCDTERLQTQAASHTEQMAEQVGLVEALTQMVNSLLARVAQLEEQQAITVQGNDDANFHLHQTVNSLSARVADLEAQGQQATTVSGNEADVEDADYQVPGNEADADVINVRLH